MNILDENIIAPERERLRGWRIHFRYIGQDIGHSRMKDRDEIIPLLHSLRRPTFFTRDHGFYDPKLLHPGYCLVHLDAQVDETAEYVRRFLRHSTFRTQAQRIGKIVRVHDNGMTFWQLRGREARTLPW